MRCYPSQLCCYPYCVYSVALDDDNYISYVQPYLSSHSRSCEGASFVLRRHCDIGSSFYPLTLDDILVFSVVTCPQGLTIECARQLVHLCNIFFSDSFIKILKKNSFIVSQQIQLHYKSPGINNWMCMPTCTPLSHFVFRFYQLLSEKSLEKRDQTNSVEEVEREVEQQIIETLQLGIYVECLI